MISPKVHFQETLKELLRLNSPDLDFGWYHVVNEWRPVLEKWVEVDLENLIDKTIARTNCSTITPDIIYAHVSAFFDQCVQGELLVKREKNGKSGGVQAIGSIFAWKDVDQFYVSNTHAQRCINVKLSDWRIQIIAGDTNIVQGNVDKNTYFWVPSDFPLSVHEKEKRLEIILKFRPLNQEEQKAYSSFRNKQDEIFRAFEKTLYKQISNCGQNPFLRNEESQAVLHKYLLFFTKIGARDRFIHKNLRKFLAQKRRGYLSNILLPVGEKETSIKTIVDASAQESFEIVKVLSVILEEIANFLTKIEEFQLKVYLAPRQVNATHFCVPWAWLPTELQGVAFSNERQLGEWKSLYDLNPASPEDVPPQTFVDTSLFAEEFKEYLFSHKKDIISSHTGYAIHGDNYQALNLLRDTYQNRVRVIYIDPPYNKGNKEFLYRDSYRPQTWEILMRNVLEVGRDLLRDDGMIFVSIDDNRVHELALLMKGIFGENACIATMPVKSNPRGRSMEQFIATSHEYLLFFAKNPAALQVADNLLTQKQIDEYNKRDERGSYRLLELRNRNPQFARHNRPNLFYPIYFNATTGEFDLVPKQNWVEILPRNTQGKDGVWRWSKEKFLSNKDRIVIKQVKRAKNPYNVYKKDYLQQEKDGKVKESKHKTFLEDPTYNYQNGKRIAREMFGETLFGNPKPLALIDKCLDIATTEEGTIVLDFFAGSGTTGHAVIDRLRKDKKYEYILVEIGQIFDDLLLPRLKKAAFASHWVNGIPQDRIGAPHIIKYFALENYEDALNREGGAFPK